MSRDVEIREIKPVTSDELNYVRRLFFSENNTFGHNCQWQRNKNHMKEGTTIASRNVNEMLSQVLSPAINSQSKEQLRSFPAKEAPQTMNITGKKLISDNVHLMKWFPQNKLHHFNRKFCYNAQAAFHSRVRVKRSKGWGKGIVLRFWETAHLPLP